MIHGFETGDQAAADGALLLYAAYRSRDMGKWRPVPKMWGQIEAAAQGAAVQSSSLPRFLDRLKYTPFCGSPAPRYLAATYDDASYLDSLLSNTLAGGPVLRALRRETSYIVLLVRSRLEQERSIDVVTKDSDDES